MQIMLLWGMHFSSAQLVLTSGHWLSCKCTGGGSWPSSALKWPSIISCACSYASLAQVRMMERPVHWFIMCPSGVSSHTMENAKRSTPAQEGGVLWAVGCQSGCNDPSAEHHT